MSKKYLFILAGVFVLGLVYLAFPKSGGIGAPYFGRTVVHGGATVYATPTIAVATSTGRQYLKIWNLSNTVVSCALSPNGATSSLGFILAPSSTAPGNSWQYNVNEIAYVGVIYCVGNVTSTLSYIEY